MSNRFELSAKLTEELQRLATDANLPVEFLIEDALKTAIRSADHPIIAGLRDDYERAVRAKTPCGVTMLESGGANHHSRL